MNIVKHEIGEAFNDGTEYRCPKCEHYFKYVAYPLLRDSLTDPRATLADRLFAKRVLRNVKDKRN